MASLIYNIGKKSILEGVIDLTNDTIKCILVTSSYSPDKDAHLDRADVTNEVSGQGYTSGGEELTDKSFTQDDDNDRGEFDAADITWSSAIFTARAAVLYKSTGVAANDTLIAFIDFEDDYIATEEDFTIQWDTEGILYLGE